jgi:hypothetical protein
MNTEKEQDEPKLEDLEPGDKTEQFSPFDWCLAGGCGCGGCVDPTGCMDAAGQGCLGCLDMCLGRLGCGVLVVGLLILGIFRIVGPLFAG